MHYIQLLFLKKKKIVLLVLNIQIFPKPTKKKGTKTNSDRTYLIYSL